MTRVGSTWAHSMSVIARAKGPKTALNAVLNPDRQSRRLAYLAESGFFDRDTRAERGFAAMHMKGMRPALPPVTREKHPWR